MRTLAAILTLSFLLITARAHATAYQSIRLICITPVDGGVCQMQLPALAGENGYFVSIDFAATCFPRVVNQRISSWTAKWEEAPIGAWLAPAGVRFNEQLWPYSARVSYYVHNSSTITAWTPWIGIVWECEGMLP